MIRKVVVFSIAGILGLVILFGLIQLIPISETNPAVQQEPNWDSSQTRSLAVQACYDCHSNETVWPWYSKVAPISWLIANDVQEGRQTLNFSEWNRQQRGLDEVGEVIQEGQMPPGYYILLHPDAKLSAPEKKALTQGLQQSLGITVEQGEQGEDD